jgi:hypothetical protein
MASALNLDHNGNQIVTNNSDSSDSSRNNKTKSSNSNNKLVALVEAKNNNNNNRRDVDSQFLLYSKINTKKITLTHQFFTLSLLEYICNLLSPNDRSAAEVQFQG